MQKNLASFYREYLAWLEDGSPKVNEHNFSRGYGLCTNIIVYNLENDGESVNPDCWPAKTEMTAQFSLAGLDDQTPFNPIGHQRSPGNVNYFNESFDEMCHLNEKRIAWVKLHAAIE